MSGDTKPVCPTCSAKVDGSDQVTHEPSCATEQLKKHRNALQKIGHILKEVGITTAETAAEIVFSGTGAGGDS